MSKLPISIHDIVGVAMEEQVNLSILEMNQILSIYEAEEFGDASFREIISQLIVRVHGDSNSDEKLKKK